MLCIAQLMLALDATVVNIALPHAQAALSFSGRDRQWVVTAYSLAFGSLLLPGGRVADLAGRRRTFLAGLAGFAVASAAGGAAVNFPMLVTARAVQGAFGALLAPAALSLLTMTFPNPDERGRAFGIFGGMGAVGASAGLLAGGVLTEYLDWRWVIVVNVAFSAVALAGGSALPVGPPGGPRPDLDLPGALLACGAPFFLVYGFSQTGPGGWTGATTLGVLAAGVTLGVAFFLIERRTAHPLLPLRIVLDRNRGGACLSLFLVAAGMFAMYMFLTYYLETSLGYSPVEVGLAFLPMMITTIITSSAGNFLLLKRVRAQVHMPGCLLASALGLALLTRLGMQSHYLTSVLPGTLMIGSGLGLMFAPAFSLGTLGVAAGDAGVAAATLNVTQQIGGSFGVGLINSLAAATSSRYVAANVGHAPLQLVLARAALRSYATAFWAAAGAFALAAGLAAVLLRGNSQEPRSSRGVADGGTGRPGRGGSRPDMASSASPPSAVAAATGPPCGSRRWHRSRRHRWRCCHHRPCRSL